jgi:hypothetical protein
VETETPDTSRSRPGRAALGERLGGFIYGTIIVLAVVVAGARAYPSAMGHVAGLVLVTVFVLWIAHVYSHALAYSVGRDEHLSIAELRDIARHEASIIEAAVPPIGALLLGELGIINERTAVWLALGLGLAVLATQGFRFARLERLGRLATVVVVAVNMGLGLLIVGLKLVVSGH